MRLVALVTDAMARARLAGALRERVTALHFCARVQEVRALFASGAVRALLVEPRDADGHPADELVRELCTRWPSATVIAWLDLQRAPASAIVPLVRAGAHAVVLRGVDDERHAILAALRGAEQRHAADLVAASLRPHVPDAAWPVFDAFLRHAAEPVTVASCARTLGVHRKTLVNRLAAAGCLSPLAVRTWCRMMIVAHLLEEPGRTVESIAMELDFPSATALRNQCRRWLGATPREVVKHGGLAYAIDRFRAALLDAQAARQQGLLLRGAPHGASRHARQGSSAAPSRPALLVAERPPPLVHPP